MDREGKPAVVVVDMIVDNVHGPSHWGITAQARAIIPGINELLAMAHKEGWPVIFANDSFLAEDFIFGGRMKPHALRGSPGAEVIPELSRGAGDMVLPKRRLSAFFKTDLDQTLRTLGVGRVLVAGISTCFCVLATALDALSHDLAATIVEDCCAAPTPEAHQASLSCYRTNALQPLFEIKTLARVKGELAG